MQVSEVMTRKVTIASPSDSLRRAAELMEGIDAGVLLVGENDRLVGMLTDRDITLRAVATGLLPEECTVGEVMSPQVLYVYEDQTVEDAARNMSDLKIRRLPVLNRQKRLVGVVSLGDLALKKESTAAKALKGVSRH
jgi:CBS domain-containing protein